MSRFFTFLFILISFGSYAQISHGGKPFSLFNKTSTTKIPTYITPPVDIQQLKNEDVITDQYKDIPWRFGTVIPVNLNLTNAGSWDTLSNGDRLWRLIIKSPSAKTININYSAFYLPENSTFFVYSKSDILGSFTHINNKADGKFATSLIKGDQVILEYYEPKNQAEKGVIQLSSIIHGYRNLLDKAGGFGNSGSCNINATCDTTIWGDEIRSAVMILTASNSRLCSGALINNAREDGTPYVLTANHCNPATNNIFMFNYMSSSCSSNNDGIITQTISGCTLIASDTPSDFNLVKLSSAPPANYKVFYAGWSNINVAPNNTTVIHHPSGDIKKISHDLEQAEESGYYSSGINHWKIIDWNTGSTEGGSSGAPFFDQNHRIIGQLHGGNASCANDLFDFCGKFSYSWNTNTDTLQQLKYWLDPDNTGTTFLDGYDPNGSNYSVDAALISISGVSQYICGDSATPTITLKNKGNNTLTSLDIYYSLDGGSFTLFNWTGNLLSYKTDTINIPPLSGLTGGNHQLAAYCTNPNGTGDENLFNDTISINFEINNQPHFVTLNLKTDNWGSETTWTIKDLLGKIVAQGGPYADVLGGELYADTFCLPDGCFTFEINDNGSDGFCCSYGQGSLLLTDNLLGDTLAFDTTFSTVKETFSLKCFGVSCPTVIKGTVTDAVFGNNRGSISLNISDGSGDYSFSWSDGSSSKNISDLFPGTYGVVVTDNGFGCADSAIFTTDRSANAFYIYPNPNSGRFTVAIPDFITDKIEIQVYDVIGKLVTTRTALGGKKEMTLDLSPLKKGVYLISFSTDERERIIEKIIIK